jgi:hypothetical protein
MDKRLVGLIQRALLSPQAIFPFNASWQALHREYNIGSPLGNQIRLTERDKAELVDLVRQMVGLDLRNASVAEFDGLSRHEALRLGRDEKWAGRAVGARRLLLKALPGKPLWVNGLAFPLASRSHLDIALETVEHLAHQAVIVVENYECFDRIGLMRLVLDERWADAAVVYRGDPNASRTDAVHEFLRAQKLPVLAMVDIDPSGLVIAQTLPGVTGILAPPVAVINALLAQGNPALYQQQRPGAEQSLLNSPHPLIRQWWRLIESHGAGLAQERWLHGDVEVVVHGLG